MKLSSRRAFVNGQFLFTFLCVNTLLISAQEQKAFDATHFQTEWKLIKNVSAEDPNFHATLTVTNKISDPLPSSAWRIHFNLRSQH